jgi:1-deoxy-D-xylulose-5-phosphate reductoisomerase
MRLPIGYALAYPDRLPDKTRIDAFAAVGERVEAEAAVLRFERPDHERFPCLALAYRSLCAGGTAPAALSAANEIAVRAFVEGKIRFGDIPRVIEAVLDATPDEALSLETVRAADAHARRTATEAVEARLVSSPNV